MKRRDRGMGYIYLRGAVWWMKYHVNGQPVRESTGEDTESKARKVLNQRILDTQAGRATGPDVAKTTLAELLDLLEQDYGNNHFSNAVKIKSTIKHVREWFAGRYAADCTSDRIGAYTKHRLAEGASNASINRELAAIGRAFKLGLIARKVAVIPYIAKLQERNTRKGFFEREQLDSLLKHLPEYARPLVRAAYITGWRKRELLSRQKHHLDLSAGWLRLEPGETKNGEGRMFPLTAELRELFSQMVKETRDLELKTGRIIPWLFHHNGRKIDDFRKAWRNAREAAGLPGKLVHDFRRTAVRNLERAGVPRSTAMKMTGHLTESVYRRYAIVDESMLREGAEKLEQMG